MKPLVSITKYGAPKATAFEHLCNIAQWLFANQNPAAFRLPQITIAQRSHQMLAANYAF
jgi:hypothetical protein